MLSEVSIHSCSGVTHVFTLTVGLLRWLPGCLSTYGVLGGVDDVDEVDDGDEA